jgi:hypothetical protein
VDRNRRQPPLRDLDEAPARGGVCRYSASNEPTIGIEIAREQRPLFLREPDMAVAAALRDLDRDLSWGRIEPLSL